MQNKKQISAKKAENLHYENVAAFVVKCGKNVAIKKPLLQVADLYKEFWWRWRELNPIL